MPHVKVGDQSIYYEAVGRGAPLLLLHGFGEDGRALAPLARAWRRGWRVITPDLPGQGRSRPRPRAYTRDFYEQDARIMAGALDALQVPQVWLAGFSDGAEVALWLAILRPAQVRAVVAWGVAGALTPVAEAEIAAVAAVLDAPRPEWRTWRDALLHTYGEAGARRLIATWAAALRGILAAGGDISLSRAGEIRCPVLLLNGEADPLNPPGAVRRLASAIPQAEVMVLPDTGHAVHWAHFDWFKHTVGAWLARQRP